MGIPQGVGRVATGADRQILAGGRSGLTLDASCDQTNLLLAITDGPVAAGLANDIELFQQRTLVPTLADLHNLPILIEYHDVSLGKTVNRVSSGTAASTESNVGGGGAGSAYDGQIDGPIGQEVVIKTREVGSSTRDKLESGLDLCGDGILALDDGEEALLLLLDLVAQGAEVLDDLSRSAKTGGRSYVVQRRVRCQRRRIGRSEKLLVCSLQRHVVFRRRQWIEEIGSVILKRDDGRSKCGQKVC